MYKHDEEKIDNVGFALYILIIVVLFGVGIYVIVEAIRQSFWIALLPGLLSIVLGIVLYRGDRF